MNKREAKRAACWHAALVLYSNLAAGWESLYERYPEEDADRIVDALNEITEELFRRSGRGSAE